MNIKNFDRKKDRANWFITNSHDPDCIERLKRNCKEFRQWFWIMHEPDSEDGSPHIHVMVRYSGSCLIKTAARLLDIPENFVQPCYSHRGHAQYLIHMHNDEKIKYKPEDVHTNFPGLYKSMLIDHANDDAISIFGDLDRFYTGKITFEEFCESHYLEIQKMTFYQKIQTYKYLKNCRSALPD